MSSPWRSLARNTTERVTTLVHRGALAPTSEASNSRSLFPVRSQAYLLIFTSSVNMLFTTACSVIALAALPFAAAASPDSSITPTQFANITEPARNTSSVLVNVISGSLEAFGSLGGSSTIDWSDETGRVGGELRLELSVGIATTDTSFAHLQAAGALALVALVEAVADGSLPTLRMSMELESRSTMVPVWPTSWSRRTRPATSS